MLLKQLLKNLDYTLVQGCLNTEVTDIYYDSRKVTPGGLFVCIVGTQRDSHDLAADCVAKGVNTLVIQHDIDLSTLPGVTVVKVESSRYAMALMSANLFGNPARQMTMIGVTGTKGKTTTTHMIKSVLEAAIAEAEQVDTALYTPESAEAFTEALNAAKAVNEDAEATQEQIDQAVNDLAAAKAGLVERADKSELNRAITAANAVDTENCTDNSVAALKEALAAANALLDDENASQDAVDAAVSALDEAVANMVAKASDAAMNALQLLVDNANAMRDDYSEEEFADVLAAINEAQALLDDRGNTTPGQMVSATLKLSEAIRDLNAEESVDALRADVQATIDFINENILNNVEGLRPAKVQALKDAVKAAQDVVNNPDATVDELKGRRERR